MMMMMIIKWVILKKLTFLFVCTKNIRNKCISKTRNINVKSFLFILFLIMNSILLNKKGDNDNSNNDGKHNDQNKT